MRKLIIIMTFSVAMMASTALACKDTFNYQYNAKFVCGSSIGSVRILPGKYATAVNIINSCGKATTVGLRISLTYPPTTLPAEPFEAGAVSGTKDVRLLPGQAFEVDCGEIPDEFKFPDPPMQTLYVKGFLTIMTKQKIGVTAVYTTSPFIEREEPPSGISIDVETIKPIRIKRCR